MQLHAALLVVASMALAIHAAPTSIFVSPSGSDVSGDGSMGNPFASVARAQTAVRRINVGMSDDIFVYLREGQYFLDSTVDLTPADNGFNGFQVNYEAYNGEEVVLHGGVQVTGWRQVPGSSIWTAPLPAGIADTRQVYINGERMQPTNTGAGIPGTVTITSDGYTTTDPLNTYFAPNQDPSDIEYLYTGVGSSWTECRVRVAAVSRSQGITRITMEQPAFQLARNKFYGQGVDKPASVSNIYALLGASSAGKYYFNTAQRTIYYVPRAKDNMTSAVVIVPKTEVLLRATGQYATDLPVANLTFHGLTFAYAGWLEPNQGLGYVDLQSGFRMLPSSTADDTTWVPVPSNVQFHTAEFINITNCTFAHLGATALMVDQGSQNIVIQGNIFTDISGGGVYVGQVNDVNVTDPKRENSHFLIDNNLFDSIPVEYRDCAAVLGGFMLDTNITHNSILNTPNTGISLGWGWSRDQAQNAGWNNILNNYVYGSNWLLEDGGSLYVLGPQPYSTMGSNYISNQKKLFGALYTDEGSAYWHMTLNVINDCPEWLHIWTDSIHDELVDFCWSNQQYQDVHGTRIVIKNITFIAPGAPFPPAAQAIINAAGTAAMVGPKP